MAGKKTKKSKQFRVATEGATVDGRVIDRSWIQDMADNYDPAKYRAAINVEHLRSLSPDGPFKNYGFVDALQAKQNAEGKLELFATITPTDDLVKMTGAMQKVFTSIEVNPKFADTGKAYLVGLAVTDTPASLGTEMLEFTAKNPTVSPLTARKQHADNHFSAAAETAIEFEDVTEEASVLDRVRALFARNRATDADRYSDLSEAINEIAEHGHAQSTRTAAQLQQVDTDAKASAKTISELTKRVGDLEEQFNTTAAPSQRRPVATGPAQVLTDF